MGEGNFLFIYFSLKGEGRTAKERTKRGITYINILHTLQKVERNCVIKITPKEN
nr:MAG TPA: hypothetical protein [Caudoviricetes sp.]